MSFRPVTANDWLAENLALQLGPNVPHKVQRLYEVARGALAYGYCFYPLYTLGIEQVSRVAEFAIDQKCEVCGVPSNQDSFVKRINWLIKRGTLDSASGSAWHGIRDFRNNASHPEQQMILPLGGTIDLLGHITERINSLFS